MPITQRPQTGGELRGYRAKATKQALTHKPSNGATIADMAPICQHGCTDGREKVPARRRDGSTQGRALPAAVPNQPRVAATTSRGETRSLPAPFR